MESKHRLEESVVAAFETGARVRGPQESETHSDPIERTIAIIESEAARLRGNDFSALNAVLAGQALALDTIFGQLAREAVVRDIIRQETLRLALKAQAQSRATLSTLVTVARPRVPSRRSEKNFDEQTIANRNQPA